MSTPPTDLDQPRDVTAGAKDRGAAAVAPEARREQIRRVATTSESRRRAAPGWGGARIYALGHSTRPIEELIELLRAAGVVTVADVRTIPRSRANPQFEQAALARALRAARIGYAHLPRLGGLRHARRDSPNGGWHNASFRGYADHMATPEFEEGLGQLRALARTGPVALLCAEAVPWRCHRSLIADALLARGVVVEHVTGRGRSRPHRLTPFARVEGRQVTYPPPAAGAGAGAEGAGAGAP
ncbi:DUF488 domain-containing protein [Anaeromyxobacter oryzisoli]|uniref:DUF488 domain-containing protein n=1 Tax=Anaeromyxobacter oryzisoli TaxID=2925408 RepID=UPI001F5ABBF4|nr:DUF488 domain-containing protein [Anaeromyxobacter sp. SG63]